MCVRVIISNIKMFIVFFIPIYIQLSCDTTFSWRTRDNKATKLFFVEFIIDP